MALDGKLLAQARKQLDDIRHRNEDRQSARQREVYARLPEVRQIDLALQSQMRELAGLALRRDDGAKEALRRLQEENLRLQARRTELVRAAGYPEDYMADHYDCPDCEDTGFVGGNMCHCLKRLYNAQVTRQLSRLLRGDESFSKFDLRYYNETPNENGDIPRECMEIIRDFCHDYAQHFDGVGPSLVFSGGPGLGKTFLSACIARVVSQRGYSVVYDGATSALSAFEKDKFSRDPEEAAAAGSTVKQYLSCDLMILDDLGTEMNTAFTQSALYTLINQRLTGGKPTIISTNLTEEGLEERYGPQIVSRLLGEYQWLHFMGTDIRRMKQRLP